MMEQQLEQLTSTIVSIAWWTGGGAKKEQQLEQLTSTIVSIAWWTGGGAKNGAAQRSAV